jgi:flagellar basal-body rod modification protein FlgD
MADPISSINGTDSSQSAADALASAASDDQGLGKDAFMKLLVAQISHQDPLKPMDDTTFVAQLAQFSSLEQSIGINTRLDALSSQERGMANTQLASLVGKNVTVKGSITTLDSAGLGSPINFTLGGNAATVDVNFTDSTGTTVRTVHLGAESAGLVKMTWDGRSDAGLAQPPGAYAVTVVAKDSAGATVDTTQETAGTVMSIGFDQGYPNLLLDNGASAPASDLLRINNANQ